MFFLFDENSLLTASTIIIMNSMRLRRFVLGCLALENAKRPIGKKNAKLFAKVLNSSYKLFL